MVTMTKIQNAVNILKKGGVAIFPTDTVYGIGTLPKKEYMEKIYKIKKRDFSKKIIALISDKNKLAELINETDENIKKIENILKKYWPGELTVIFRANQNFTKHFDKNMETIGIRIPKNETALEIIKKSGGVLLTTSANISGDATISHLRELDATFGEEVSLIVDGGTLEGLSSTILDASKRPFSVVRQGIFGIYN